MSRVLEFANRLRCIERIMGKDETFAQNSQQASQERPETRYLPHFKVVNSAEPEKIKLIFDVASRSDGISLNDQLLQVSDLFTKLATILWKFRQKRGMNHTVQLSLKFLI